jgi:hypothetical protein
MKIYTRIQKELWHVFPVFVFFLVFFTIINWIEVYLFEGIGIHAARFLEIALAAALIAKIILVVDHLPLIHRFRNYPLAYGIIWRTFFYWIVLFAVRFLVRFIPFVWSHGDQKPLDLELFFERVQWNVFFSIQAYYLMLLFIFITFQELTYKIGPRKMRKLFFG